MIMVLLQSYQTATAQ